MRKNFKFVYTFVLIVVVAITTIGATYAYWTARTSSVSNSVQAGSTIYSISMNIDPLYHGFSIIPMDDADSLKALKNGCKDKYNRGACSAYTLNIYGYRNDLQYISGYMDVFTNNMQNLSYMLFRISDNFEEDKCVVIDNKNYCIVKDATPMGDGIGLSLGDSYSVAGTTNTEFILVLWLTNLNTSQNETDIGTFNATITMEAGSGGKIQGSISAAIQMGNATVDGDNTDNNKEDNTQTDDIITPDTENSGNSEG